MSNSKPNVSNTSLARDQASIRSFLSNHIDDVARHSRYVVATAIQDRKLFSDGAVEHLDWAEVEHESVVWKGERRPKRPETFDRGLHRHHIACGRDEVCVTGMLRGDETGRRT